MVVFVVEILSFSVDEKRESERERNEKKKKLFCCSKRPGKKSTKKEITGQTAFLEEKQPAQDD